jgi:AcrR family transcriptional regulator
MKSRARDRIRNAAVALFTKKGYTATATREICRRARVTKPVLYYHFESKERLYRELGELTGASRRGSNAQERLVNVLAADFALTRREPELAALQFQLIFAAREDTPGVDFVPIGLDWVRLLAGIMRDGVRQGEMTGRPREMAGALFGVHIIYTMSYLLRGKPNLDRRLARRIVNLLMEGFVGNRRNR